MLRYVTTFTMHVMNGWMFGCNLSFWWSFDIYLLAKCCTGAGELKVEAVGEPMYIVLI